MSPRQKDFIREITGHKMRFFSLVALVLLGVFVLVGLTVTGPVIRRTVADMLAKSNAYDLRLSVSDGLKDEDLRLINDLDGVREKEYFHTGYLTTKELKTVYLSSLPKRISKPVLKEGRLPRTKDEILLDPTLKDTYRLGDVVVFDKEENPFDEDAPAMMEGYQYKVVGFATSPVFLDKSDKGTTTKGDKIDGYGYVLPSAFKDPTVTEVHFLFDDLKGVAVYSEDFKAINAARKKELHRLFKDRGEARLDALLADKREDIRDGEEDILEGYDELDRGKEKLDEGEKKLDDGARTLRDNRARFDLAIRQGEGRLADSRKKLAQARKSMLFQEDQLSAGERAFLDGKNAIAAAMAEIKAKEAQASGMPGEIETALDLIAKEQAALNDAKKMLDAGQLPPVSLPELPYTDEDMARAKAVVASKGDVAVKKAAVKEKAAAMKAADKELLDAKVALLTTGVDGDKIQEQIDALDKSLAALNEEKETSADGRAVSEKIRRAEKDKAALEEKLKNPAYVAAKKSVDEKKKAAEDAEAALPPLPPMRAPRMGG